ncbi:MAG: hypothetical protein ACK4ML_00840 [Alishewanella aestuarii]
MNDFTLMIIFSAVLLVLAVAVHLRAQAKHVGIYAPEQEEAATEPRTFIINRHAIPCISDVWVCKEGYTWLALCDELILSVVYEDGGICHCIELPHFSDLTSQYIEDGILEVANA